MSREAIRYSRRPLVALEAFEEAGVPVVVEKDLRAILPLLGFDSE